MSAFFSQGMTLMEFEWPWQWTVGVWTAVGTVLAAVGTVAAVWAALWGESWRRRRRRPVLSIHYERHDDHLVLERPRLRWPKLAEAKARGLKARPRADYRLRVHAAVGRDPAQNAHVVVTRIHTDGGSSRELLLPLIWAYSAPSSTVTTVYGGIDRLLDLAEVYFDEADGLTLQVAPEPSDDIARLLLRDGQAHASWRLELVVVADGMRPEHYLVAITYTRWTDSSVPPEVMKPESAVTKIAASSGPGAAVRRRLRRAGA